MILTLRGSQIDTLLRTFLKFLSYKDIKLRFAQFPKLLLTLTLISSSYIILAILTEKFLVT